MAQLDAAALAQQLAACGATHVVWVPDTELGPLERHLDPAIRLIRACREGEAMAIAGGLLLGGARPAVVCQSTGFFEAGDAFRNVVKDLALPLFLVVGYRGATALAAGRGRDSAARHLLPILAAWELEHVVVGPTDDPGAVSRLYHASRATGTAAAAVLVE